MPHSRPTCLSALTTSIDSAVPNPIAKTKSPSYRVSSVNIETHIMIIIQIVDENTTKDNEIAVLAKTNGQNS